MKPDEIEVGGVYRLKNGQVSLCIRNPDCDGDPVLWYPAWSVDEMPPTVPLSDIAERLPIPALDFSVLGRGDGMGIALFRFTTQDGQVRIAYHSTKNEWVNDIAEEDWHPAPEETLTYNGKQIRVTPELRAMLEKGEEVNG